MSKSEKSTRPIQPVVNRRSGDTAPECSNPLFQRRPPKKGWSGMTPMWKGSSRSLQAALWRLGVDLL